MSADVVGFFEVKMFILEVGVDVTMTLLEYFNDLLDESLGIGICQNGRQW
jgi:hypothetical protein